MMNYADAIELGKVEGMRLTDVLTDVCADVRGVAVTIWAIADAPEPIEPEQLRVLGDVLALAADALRRCLNGSE